MEEKNAFNLYRRLVVLEALKVIIRSVRGLGEAVKLQDAGI